MESSGEGSSECVVHVDVHGECVMFVVVGGCNIVATEHGRHSLSCMQKLSSAGSVWYVGSFKLFIPAERGRYELSFM